MEIFLGKILNIQCFCHAEGNIFSKHCLIKISLTYVVYIKSEVKKRNDTTTMNRTTSEACTG